MDDPEDVLAIVRCTYRTAFNKEDWADSDMGQWISFWENSVVPLESTDKQGLDTFIESDISQKENDRDKDVNKDNTRSVTVDDTPEKGNQATESSVPTDQDTKITVDNACEIDFDEKQRTEEPYYTRIVEYIRSWWPFRREASKDSSNADKNDVVDIELGNWKCVQQDDENDVFQQKYLYQDTMKFDNERTRDVEYTHSNELQRENKRLLIELENIRKRAQHDYEAAKERYDLPERKLVDQRKENGTFEEKYRTLETELSHFHTKLVKIEQELQTTKQEKEDAQKRLSELMSARLRDNNPNIVDLSDQYRPTKLAEMMNELYDNQWTSLFFYIEEGWISQGEFPERACIQLLLDIVMEAYKFCSVKLATDSTNSVIQLFGQEFSDLDAELLKIIKDNRKRSALCTLVQVRKNCIPILKRLAPPNLMSEEAKDSNELIEYMNECLKLCWLMVLQDPPVYLVCDGWKRKSNLKDDHDDDDDDDDDADKKGETEPALQVLSFNEESRTEKEENSGLINNVVGESRLADEEQGNLSELDRQGDRVPTMPITKDGVTLQHSNCMENTQYGVTIKTCVCPEEMHFNDDETEYGQSLITSDVLQEPDPENNDTNTQLSNNRVDDQVTMFGSPDSYNKSETNLEVVTQFDRVITNCNMNMTEQENAPAKTRKLSSNPDKSKSKLLFSKDLYKEYTRRGPYIDYIVWPVMYLHKDGPLLNKGVAQGCK